MISQLTGFDDKFQAYASSVEVTPHLAFSAKQAYITGLSTKVHGNGRLITNRGRGGGFFSTSGRGFHQHITSGSSRSHDPTSRPTCQIIETCGMPSNATKGFTIHIRVRIYN